MNYAVIGSLVLVLLYNLFFFPPVLGIGIGFTVILGAIYLYYTRNRKSKTVSYAFAATAVNIVFGFFCGFRASQPILFINNLTLIFCGFTALYFYKKETPLTQSPCSLLAAPFHAMAGAFRGLFTFVFQPRPEGTSKNTPLAPIVRGSLIALPVLLVLLFLLTQADPIFSTLSKRFLDTIAERLFFSVLLFICTLSYGLTLLKERVKEKTEPASFRITESIIVIASVSVLLGIFLLIQLRYLFLHVPETELRNLGIAVNTYSEYVRKGFFHLLFAGIITSSIIIYTLRFLHKTTARIKQTLQILLGVLTVETGLLLLSANKRLFLYIHEHGLTHSRVFGFVFLLWLSVMLILFFIRLFRELPSGLRTGIVVFTTLIALLSINIIPVDKIIAVMYPPTVNHEVDYTYVMHLGPEGYPAWKPFMEKYTTTFEKRIKNPSLFTSDEIRHISDTQYTYTIITDYEDYLTAKYAPLNEVTYYYKKVHGSPVPVKVFKPGGLALEKLSTTRTWRAFNFGEYQAFKEVRKDQSLFLRMDMASKEMQARITLQDYTQNHPLPNATTPAISPWVQNTIQRNQ